MNANVNSTTFFANSSPQSCHSVIAVTSVRITLIICYTVAIVVSVLGNCAVVLVTCKNRNLRTTTHVLIANMAVSDMLYPLFYMPYALRYLISQNPAWPMTGAFGSVLCQLRFFLPQVSVIVSITSLVAIAIDRFIAVVYPSRANFRTRRSRVLTIISIWLIAITFTLLRKNEETKPSTLEMAHNGTECLNFSTDAPVEKLRKSKNATLYTTSFFLALPLLIITVLYTAVAMKMRRHVDGNPGNERQEHEDEKNRSLIYLCIVVAIIFVLCWAPKHVLTLVVAFYFKSVGIPCWLNTLWFLNLSLSDCVIATANPVIYFGFCASFRTALASLCGVCCGKKFDFNTDMESTNYDGHTHPVGNEPKLTDHEMRPRNAYNSNRTVDLPTKLGATNQQACAL